MFEYSNARSILAKLIKFNILNFIMNFILKIIQIFLIYTFHTDILAYCLFRVK